MELVMRRAALLVVTLSAVAQGAPAQDTLAIEPGERVRLYLESSEAPVTGVLVAQDKDSLRVQSDPKSRPTAFARVGVSSVDASMGYHGHAGTGALVGLLAGGIAGAALGASCEGDFLCPGGGGGALLLGGTGLLFGALVGVFVRTERWESVYPGAPGLALVKMPRGFGVGLSIGL
jgi:hypothetical protein